MLIVGVLAFFGVLVVGREQLDPAARVDQLPRESRRLHRVVEPALEPGPVHHEGVGLGQREQLRRRGVEAMGALAGGEELGDIRRVADELPREVADLGRRRHDPGTRLRVGSGCRRASRTT